MNIQPPEKPIADPQEWPDYYLEWGCCVGCDETRKEQNKGLRRLVFYDSKFYTCLCSECKCGFCTWLYDGECQRKVFDDYGLAT